MKQKIDKGFELVYWNLSYRRKFIRTLWQAPLCILSTGFTIWAGCNLVVPIALVIVYIGQLIYTYYKWKK